MAGLFSTFNTAVKGLNANQTALHTTSHNISNANTEGFSRQRVEMKADNAYNYAGVGQLGTGVKLEGVVRMVDEFVDLQIRQESSTLNQYMAKNDVMGQIEMVFNEPSDSGLNFAMGEMFNAWQELSKNPESLNAKSIVAEKSKTFADTVRHMATQIQELQGDTVAEVQKNVFDLASMTDQLKVVNEQIFNITVKGQSPNDLLDQRDLLLKNMSGITEIKTSFDSWGRASVTVGGKNITDPHAAAKLSAVQEVRYADDGSATVHVALGGDTANVQPFTMTAEEAKAYTPGSPVFVAEGAAKPELAKITSGALGGKLQALTEIDARIAELDTFARGTAQAVNMLHNPNGDGQDLFTGSGSLDFAVSKDILEDESLVVTGKTGSSAPGDGSRALAIANLRNLKINFSDLSTMDYADGDMLKLKDAPGGMTVEGAYQDVVIKVGISTEHAGNMVQNQEALLAQLSNRRESVSGVSVDEEVTNLIKFQRSFEANSRVISTISEMLDTLINRTGV